MKSTTRPPACCLLLLASACFGQGTAIDVINNSQDWLKLYRLGDPGNTVEVQKRWNQTISLPLVAGGSDNMQMIEVNREGTSITTPETSFQGFDGAFAQNCTLTVSASSISIEYRKLQWSLLFHQPGQLSDQRRLKRCGRRRRLRGHGRIWRIPGAKQGDHSQAFLSQ